jgi:glycosyltransferase involved in cell wall biosynthesis
LTIVGSFEFDRVYAGRCQALLARSAPLAGRVHLKGELSQKDTARELSRSNLLVSSSCMESYGMALAEARSTGVPILALNAGNAKAHVTADGGGELVRTHRELVSRFLELCRSTEEHGARIANAQATRCPPRDWSEAAQDFIRQCVRIPLSRPSVSRP